MKKSWMIRIRRLQLLTLNIYIYIYPLRLKRIICLPRAVLRRIKSKVQSASQGEAYRTFNRYYSAYQWEQLYQTGNEIIESGTFQPYILHRLAYSSNRIGNPQEATEYMERYLLLAHKLGSPEVVATVRSVLEEEHEIESSTYQFLGGMANCGFVQTVAIERHSRERKPFMTKLVKGEHNQDEAFYRVVYPMIDELHPMIPKLVDLRTLSGLTLLTTEKVEGRTPSEEDFGAVLEENRAIEAIPFKKATAIFKVLDINVHERFFISKWSLKQSYLSMYLTLASKTDDPERIYATFTRLYRMLRDIKISQLATAASYCFCHGDFNKNNIFVQDESVMIIDWTTHYRLAPLGFDISTYFHVYEHQLPDFSTMREQYLDQRFPLHGDTRQNAVSILLFIHRITYLRVIRLKSGELEADYERFFLPAVEYAIDIASRYLGYREAGQKAFTR